MVDTFNPELPGRIAQAVRAYAFDAVIATQIDLAPYALGLPVGIKVLDELEVASQYEQFSSAPNRLRRLRAGLMWGKHKRYVAEVLRAFGACTVVSENERALVRRTVANGIPLPRRTQRRGRLCVRGRFWDPGGGHAHLFRSVDLSR